LKSLVFIEHNVVARHFLQSRAFDDFAGRHETMFVFPEQGHRRISQVEPSQLELPGPHEHLTILPERQIIWKWLYLVEQLRWKSGAQAKALRRLHRCNAGWKAAILLTALGLPGIRQGFQWVARRKLRALPFDGLRELLDREQPDILIHPCVMEGMFLNDLIEESKRRNIPLVVIMNSWDNPSTKRAMIGNPDWLLVWGEQTHRHAVDLAGMPPERTLKFGAAQFEVYRESPQMNRDEFCELNGVDPALPLLVYAGSSKGTREIDHLRQLDAAVESGALPPVNILYRPHPWGNGGEGGANILDEPWRHVAIEHSMREYLEQVRAAQTQICLSDYRHTHEVLTHCDALISPLSTIILEAALHGKPAMCFLPVNDQSNHFRNDSRLMHFQDMFGMQEILVAHGARELLPRTIELLARSRAQGWAEKMAKAAEYFVEPHDNPYGERITEFCEAVVEDRETEKK
jgi:hypothetical protein